ncbi:hypothetical protein JKP88DRAFT_276045 [Tribonema minus]|uniref:Uncharacterized protein n=1 Tax=Tribonema minus TaxID=303371 RepID=A0A835Z6A4_9STRA|nr:hypothetical protein JKP88DRAFT_276045 [Tribonema minus]
MALNDDITRAEEAALAAVKKYGAKSPEAANAWDEYEEIAASDNTAAFRPGLDEGCDTEASQECSDFEAQMAELQAIIEKGEAVTTDALVAQNKKLIEENQRLRRSLSAYK